MSFVDFGCSKAAATGAQQSHRSFDLHGDQWAGAVRLGGSWHRGWDGSCWDEQEQNINKVIMDPGMDVNGECWEKTWDHQDQKIQLHRDILRSCGELKECA